MRKLLGVAVLLAAPMVAVVASAAADTGGTNRPFTGTVVGSATFPFDASCPIGLRTVGEGSGTASHLGVVSMSGNHCTAPANAITGGRQTLVAANGDELHMTYSGTCDAPPFPPLGEAITCSQDTVIVGGTGRFADATGEAQMTVYVTYVGIGVPVWPLMGTWEGTLSY